MLGAARAARNAGDLAAAADLLAAAPTAALPPESAGAVQEVRASVSLLRGELAAALDAARLAREALASAGCWDGVARVVTISGEALYRKGDHVAACEAFAQAADLARQAGAHREENDAHWRLARTDRTRGRLPEARDRLQGLLPMARERGDQRIEGLTLRDLGNVELKAGRYPEAEQLLRQAANCLERAGFRPDAAGARVSLGELARAQGRYADARREYSAALSVLRAFRITASTVVALIDLGATELALGQAAKAAWRLQELDELLPPPASAAAAAGAPSAAPSPYRPYVEALRMAVRAASGDWAGAEDLLASLVGPQAKPPADADFLFLLEQTGDAARAAPDPTLAEDAYGFAQRVAEQLGSGEALERIRGKVVGMSGG
jgi:tetratricopeptide (TPR) repeat protein